MPRYEITGPDGRRFEIDGPEGSTLDDAISYAQKTFYGAAIKPPPVEAPALVSPEEMLTPVADSPQVQALKQKTQEYEAGTSMFERAKQDIQRGVLSALNIFPSLSVSGRQKEIERIRRGEAGRTDTLTGEFIPLSPEEEEAAIKTLQQAQAEDLQSILKRTAESQAIPARPVTEEIGKAKTFGEALEALKADPFGAMAGFSLESLPQMAPALAVGLATKQPIAGAVAMGGTSFSSELGNSVFEYLQDQGIDINDKDAVLKALDNPQTFNEAYNFALKRGAIIGSLDAASAGLASKALVPKKLIGSPAARETINVAIAQPVSQMVSGAGGEALAQLSTYGEIKKPGAVVAEAIGEGPTSIAETAAFGGRRIYEELRARQEAKAEPESRIEPTIAPVVARPEALAEEVPVETPGIKEPELPAVVSEKGPAPFPEVEAEETIAEAVTPKPSDIPETQEEALELLNKVAKTLGETFDEGDQKEFLEKWEKARKAQKLTPAQELEGSGQAIVREAKAEAPDTQTYIQKMLPVEVPVAELKLSKDVPQFKSDANEQGVVERLGGKFEREGLAPIQVWRRTNGDLEVISGRHRLDLARRSGEQTIPAQIFNESDGFDAKRAAIMDAELNIRDEKGKVKDYVTYFKETKLPQDEAESRGLLARSVGKRAYTIANEGSEELITALRNEAITDEGAFVIAKNAPNNPKLQAVGIQAIQKGLGIGAAANKMQALKAMAGEADTSIDMFGFDSGALKEAEEMGKIADRKQREIGTRLAAISGAAKNPKLAKQEGIDIRDENAIAQRVEELRQLKSAWDNWPTNPELRDEIRAEMRPAETKVTPAPKVEVEVEKPKKEVSFYYDLLPEAGFKRLDIEDPRTYKNKAGEPFVTYERNGVRAAFSSNNILYADERGRVDVYSDEPKNTVFRALIVDPKDRRKGKASQAMSEIIRMADESGTNLYMEPASLDTDGMTTPQLKEFYKRFGFEPQKLKPTTEKVLVRMAGKKAPAVAKKPVKPTKEEQAEINRQRQEEKRKAAEEAKAAEKREEKAIADREVELFKLQPPVQELEAAPTGDLFGAKELAAQPAKKAPAPPTETGLFAKEEPKVGQVVSTIKLPESMEARVFKTSEGYGAGLYDAESKQFVNGSVRRYKGDDARSKAEAYAKETETKATKPEKKEVSEEAKQDKVMKLAKRLLAKKDAEVTTSEIDYEGKTYEAKTTIYKGKLFPSELQDIRNAYGNAKNINLINEDQHQLTLKLTGQYASEKYAVGVVETVYTPKEKFTKEQIENAQTHADEVGGEIAYQNGDYALIRGYSALTGDPVYVPTFKSQRAKVDVESFTGKQVPDDIRQEMIQAKKQAEKEATDQHKTNPFIKFENGVAISKDISSEMAGIIRGWKDLLKLDVPVYVSTVQDAKANRNNFTGPHRRIGSGTLDSKERGSMRRMADDSYYILFDKSSSPTFMLEVIAHEMGHLHERLVFEKATPEQKEALKNAHQKWLEKQTGKTAKELVQALRGRATARTAMVPDGRLADELSPYWKSFGEWYADQVSRWAVSAEEPVSIVEKFFKKLGNQLRQFYQKLKNAKYLPDETFVQYLNKVNEQPVELMPETQKSDIAEKMSEEFFDENKGTQASEENEVVRAKGRRDKENEIGGTEGKNVRKLLDETGRINTPMLEHEPTKRAIFNIAQQGKEIVNESIENPRAVISNMVGMADRGLLYLRNQNVWFGSGLNAADFSRYNGQLRTSEGLATASVALDNAIRGGNIYVQVVMEGGIEWNDSYQNFVAAKKPYSMKNVYKAEASLKKQIGDQTGQDLIQGYLEAKRSRSIQNEYYQRSEQIRLIEEAIDQTTNPDSLKQLQKDLIDAQEDFDRISIVYEKIAMTDEVIDEFIAQEKKFPELRSIMDNWTDVNQNLLRFWRQTGVLSEKRYNQLSSIQDYVPWQRIMTVEEDPHSPVQSTTKTMTNVGKERVFKKGVPKVSTTFIAKENQKAFRIQPSSVVAATVNGTKVPKDKFTVDSDGAVQLNVPISAGDVVVFEGIREIENIIDNMTRNVGMMVMNGLRNYAGTRIVSEYGTRNEQGQLKTYKRPDREQGIFNVLIDGRRVNVQVADPLIATAALGMETMNLEAVRIFGAIANITRRSITLSGAFQIKQVFKDAPTAALVTGVKRPDLLLGGVYKGFVTALTRSDPAFDILRKAGIGGFHSPARTPEAEVKRQIGIVNRSVYDWTISLLDRFGDSADYAQRIATYNRVLKETGDEAQALFQAANVINFLHHGSGQLAQAAVRTVPFLGAYANSIDVLAQAIAGGGIKGISRKKALKRIAITGGLLTGVTLLYCMLLGADDDYWELDDDTRLKNFIVPFLRAKDGSMLMMPMNTTAAFFFKAIPELIYHKVIKEGTESEPDARRLRKALGNVAADTILGPTPIAAGVKPAIEIAINYNFFTGRPVIPRGMENEEAWQQYTASTSELGKFLSAATGGFVSKEKRLLNPIEADHFVRGIFGSAGAMAQWSSNVIHDAITGDERRPAPTTREMPLVGGFVTPPVPRGREDLFYDFKKLTDEKYETFMSLVNRKEKEEAKKYLEENKKLIGYHEYTNEVGNVLKEINAEIRRVSEIKIGEGSPLTAEGKRDKITKLQMQKNQVLKNIQKIRNDAMRD